MQQTCKTIDSSPAASARKSPFGRTTPARCYRSRLTCAIGSSWAQFVKRHLGSIAQSAASAMDEKGPADSARSHTLAVLGLQRDPKSIDAYVAERTRELHAVG